MRRRIYTMLAVITCMAFLVVGHGAKDEKTEPTETIQTEDTEDTAPAEEPETETEIETEIETETETETETEEPEEQYTYTDRNKIMYAKQSVNVRDLPSKDGNKLGKLSKEEEVTVTGQCNETGWYRIEYNGGIGYVSESYLVNEQPAEQPDTPPAQEQPANEEYPDLPYNLYEVTFDGTSFTWYTDGNPDGYQSAVNQMCDIVTSQNLPITGSPFEWNSTSEELGRYKNKGNYAQGDWMFVSRVTCTPTF